MSSSKGHQLSQYFVARDIIDMARDFSKDYDVLEYLSNICFNLAQAFGSEATAVDWDTMFSVLDQAYFSKNSLVLSDLDAVYNKVVSHLEKSAKIS